MKEMYFATGNLGKTREVQNILQIPVNQIKLDLIEIQSIDVKQIIEAKAKDAYDKFGEPVLVEDTGLHFEAWNGLPGALITWFMKSVDNDGICEMLQSFDNKKAVAVTIVGYYDGEEFHSFEGEIKGQIVNRPRGDMGFGWDPIFQPEGSTKTFAEMTQTEKDTISMRKKAVEKLRIFIMKE